MNFYIADPHFGHANIIKLCDRPFATIEEMDKSIIDSWNRKVEKNDTVYILGDFAKNLTCANAVVNQLNGKKILIRGNHDTDPICKLFSECYSYLEVDDEGQKLILCHYPIYDWNGMYRKSGQSIHLYGHIHEKTMIRDNAHCVSVEHVGYEPVTLKEIISKLD